MPTHKSGEQGYTYSRLSCRDNYVEKNKKGVESIEKD